MENVSGNEYLVVPDLESILGAMCALSHDSKLSRKELAFFESLIAQSDYAFKEYDEEKYKPMTMQDVLKVYNSEFSNLE
jgi:hypothetical protein